MFQQGLKPFRVVPAKSRHLWNSPRDGDCFNALFLCLTTISVKKFFLLPNLNLPCHTLRPFLVLSPVTDLHLTADSFQAAVTASGTTLFLHYISFLYTLGTANTHWQNNNTARQENKYLRVAGAIEKPLKFEISAAFTHWNPKRALNL